MSNVCDNYVTISGSKMQIDQLIRDKFDFEKIADEPCSNYYPDRFEIERLSPTELSLYLYTKWAPPEKIYKALIKSGMTIDAIYYVASNMAFGSFSDGVLSNYCIYDISDMKVFICQSEFGQQLEKHFRVSQYLYGNDKDDEVDEVDEELLDVADSILDKFRSPASDAGIEEWLAQIAADEGK